MDKAITAFQLNARGQSTNWTEVLPWLIAKYRDSVRVGYDIKDNVGRVILTAFRHANSADPFIKQCNGLIFHFPSWNVLARPMPVANSRIKIAKRWLPKINGAVDQTNGIDNYYTIYEALDGTVINLYFYDGEWQIGSKSGIDIRRVMRGSTKTIADLLAECVYVGTTSQIDYESLDKSKTYCVGFKHPDTHPLPINKTPFWTINEDIRCCDGSIVTHQKPITFPSGIKNLYQFMTTANTSALTTYFETGNVHCGYILRANCGSDVLMESALLSKMCRLIYNLPKHQEAINTQHIGAYSALRVILNGRDKRLFIKMFPTYRSYVKEFEQIIRLVVKGYMWRLAGNEPVRANGELIFDETVDLLDSKLLLTKTITDIDRNTQKVVSDSVTDPKFLPIYYKKFIEPVNLKSSPMII